MEGSCADTDYYYSIVYAEGERERERGNGREDGSEKLVRAPLRSAEAAMIRCNSLNLYVRLRLQHGDMVLLKNQLIMNLEKT